VYLCGYPNSALYAYDLIDEWIIGTNPISLGTYFATAGTKYPYYLKHHNGRVYMLGRHERDSLGSGVGYYSISGATYSGTSTNLDNYTPAGMVILAGISRVVIAGKSLDGSDGKIVVYDLNLNEIARYSINTGVTDAGILCTTSNSSIVVAISRTQQTAYRFNVTTGTLLSSLSLGGTVGGYVQPADGGLVYVKIGNAIKALDPNTLSMTTAHASATNVGLLAWQHGMYRTIDATLYSQRPASEQSQRQSATIGSNAGMGHL